VIRTRKRKERPAEAVQQEISEILEKYIRLANTQEA
jgi:hypothetical protein